MPRRDRTFTWKDHIRFFCRNLSREEQIESWKRFRFLDPDRICTEEADVFLLEFFSCDTLRDIRELFRGLCTFRQYLIVLKRFRLMRLVPAVELLIKLLEQSCNFSGYLSLIIELYCPDGGLTYKDLRDAAGEQK